MKKLVSRFPVAENTKQVTITFPLVHLDPTYPTLLTFSFPVTFRCKCNACQVNEQNPSVWLFNSSSLAVLSRGNISFLWFYLKMKLSTVLKLWFCSYHCWFHQNSRHKSLCLVSAVLAHCWLLASLIQAGINHMLDLIWPTILEQSALPKQPVKSKV